MNRSKYFRLSDHDKGITFSIENARRIINDAKMLFEANRYSSALYLAIQGIEEIGKALLFLKYKRDQGSITKSQWDKIFCCHTEKLRAVQEAITKHCVKIRFYEGFGNSRKYYPDDEVQK